MNFGHEKLDVYRAAIEYVDWAYRFCEALKGHRNAKDRFRYRYRRRWKPLFLLALTRSSNLRIMRKSGCFEKVEAI